MEAGIRLIISELRMLIQVSMKQEFPIISETCLSMHLWPVQIIMTSTI